MKSKALLSILFSFSLFLLLQVNAGTISFKEKDGTETTLANVEIVSIKNGFIVIEKDQKRRDYPLNSISSFSPSDTSSSGGSMPGEFSDYKVLISGEPHVKGVDKNGKSPSIEIRYTITRTNSAISRIKIPYVYLYVLLSAGNDSGEREILSFSHPSKAKPKGKGYDEAAILEAVNNFNRPIRDEAEHDRDFKTEFKNFGDETVSFELKSVKSRKLLAYHVEIWGDTSIVAEKNWKDIDAKVGEKWWQRY